MAFHIDEAELLQALDGRVLPTLPTDWPLGDAWTVRSASVSDHFDYLHSLELAGLQREHLQAALVESVNDALSQYSDGVSEDAREPYNGGVAIEGDLLRVRFARVPKSNPDDDDLAPELDPIPISDIIIED